MPQPPWPPGETPEERRARREAYERLLAAARRVELPLERLHDVLRTVADNERRTRDFLATEVYDVPDSLLDDVLRVRLAELERDTSHGDPLDQDRPG